MTKTILLPAIGALALLAACDQIRTPGNDTTEPSPPPAVQTAETPPEQVEPPVPAPVADTRADTRVSVTTKRAVIDWASARADFSAHDNTSDDDAFTVAGSSGAAAVPVLLPSMPVSIATAGSAPDLQFHPLADGYYAVYPGEVYDMIINGTDRLAAAPGRTAAAGDTRLRYEQTMTGAQVAFSRYGASYLVEFACKSPADAQGDGCVSEAAAKAAVQDLLLAGTQ